MAAAWQVWDSVQDGVGDTIHIDYDGEYGSERVLIVSAGTSVRCNRMPRVQKHTCFRTLVMQQRPIVAEPAVWAPAPPFRLTP